ncbi:hypothetical protein KKB55_22420 [Myxococcota bacterium]|nr:hypothetical protein [Myxococcota bacterium]MBU1900509.1 hypothetical protein [Myxococcota bacterium]
MFLGTFNNMIYVFILVILVSSCNSTADSVKYLDYDKVEYDRGVSIVEFDVGFKLDYNIDRFDLDYGDFDDKIYVREEIIEFSAVDGESKLIIVSEGKKIINVVTQNLGTRFSGIDGSYELYCPIFDRIEYNVLDGNIVEFIGWSWLMVGTCGSVVSYHDHNVELNDIPTGTWYIFSEFEDRIVSSILVVE